LINTGWTGGKYGYGTRIPLANTRSMIHAALNGMIQSTSMRNERWFNLAVPTTCPGVPDRLLSPNDMWKDKQLYQETVKLLINKFSVNFEKYRNNVPDSVLESGPHYP
jgi:phosphoenolpyruvate carboxykinase (ATP)